MKHDATEKRNLTYWWVPILFGVIFVIIGMWILRTPVESLEKLTKIVGVIILVSGTTQLLFTFSNRESIPGWGFQLLGGLIDLAIGIILILNPEILLKIITLFVSIWLIVNAVTLIMKASEARQANHEYWKWELIFGVILLLVAILFLWHPLILGFTIAIWTATAFIILGLFRVILTIRLKRQKGQLI
ncbi:MAG: DUF308 domain-containing protein [Bacteroidota bacterium]